jgi:hypothetical protein
MFKIRLHVLLILFGGMVASAMTWSMTLLSPQGWPLAWRACRPLVYRPGEPDLNNMLVHFGYVRYKMLQIRTLIWIW